MNKANGGDGIPAELYLKSQKMMLWKCCIHYASKLGNSPVRQDWKRSVFIPIPKKGNARECSNCRTIALISHARKVTLKIFQARLQQYMNQELPDVQAEEPEIKLPISEKARAFQKNIYFSFIDCAKAFDCVAHNKLWKILKETGLPDHVTCLLRNMHAGQEATFRTRRWTMDWYQTGSTSRLCIVTLLL